MSLFFCYMPPKASWQYSCPRTTCMGQIFKKMLKFYFPIHVFLLRKLQCFLSSTLMEVPHSGKKQNLNWRRKQRRTDPWFFLAKTPQRVLVQLGSVLDQILCFISQSPWLGLCFSLKQGRQQPQLLMHRKLLHRADPCLLREQTSQPSARNSIPGDRMPLFVQVIFSLAP